MLSLLAPQKGKMAIFGQKLMKMMFLVQFLAIFVHSGLPLWIMEAVDRLKLPRRSPSARLTARAAK